MSPTDQHASRVLLQKEFYQLLLAMGKTGAVAVEQQLEEALDIIVKMSVARQGYLEIRDLDNNTFHQSHSLSEQETESVRENISTGIISEAISSGQPVVTSTAFLDPRFNTMESVRVANIEAVLCAPFKGNQAQGVIYLQGDTRFQPSDDKVKLDAQLFAEHIVPFLDQILLDYEKKTSQDPTFALRKKFRLQGIVGNSEALFKTLKSAMTVAPLDVNVLLTGESGTGKTQIAQSIHTNSKRARQPFVEVNCGALQDNLLESELFGTVRGAFSDARDKPGKIVAAGQGTLFLDEVAELTPSAQVKLLQFLQSGEFYPVGSDKKLSSQVRVLCATNQHLEDRVKKGKFREDLFFRIKTFPIRIPSLRDRRDDIVPLAEHFCQLKCVKHGFTPMTLSADVLQHFKTRDWAGNIRELDNLVESSCIYAMIDEVSTVEISHVLQTENTETNHANTVGLADGELTFQDATKAFQKDFLSVHLHKNAGKVGLMAKKLGLSRARAYGLINEFGLRRDSENGGDKD